MNKKISRNDPCPCGSGKKFKKCCERNMISNKFLAHKIEVQNPASSLASKVTGLSSVFSNAASGSTKQFKASKDLPLKTSEKEKTDEKEK